MTKTQTVRAQLIASLEKQLKDDQAKLATFTLNSKAKGAVQLRTDIANLTARIALLRAKLDKDIEAAKDKATVIDAETSVIEELGLSAKEKAYADFCEARDALLKSLGAGSSTRALVAWFSGLIMACVTGAVGGVLLDMLIQGALLLTGSAFLGLLLYVIGLVITVYAGMKLGRATYNYIADERIDAHYRLAKTWLAYKGTQVKSLFVSDKVLA